MCIHSEQGTLAHLWSGEHAGPGKASREAALVTDSNEESPELERCQSSAGLRDTISHRYTAVIDECRQSQCINVLTMLAFDVNL